MFGMDVLRIDTIVLDFLIFPALGNGEAQSVDVGSENPQKLGFFAPQIFMGHIYPCILRAGVQPTMDPYAKAFIAGPLRQPRRGGVRLMMCASVCVTEG